MKVQVTQENLAAALNSISRIAGRNTSLPILSNILLKTVKNRLFIAATNLEIAITEYIGAKVVAEGDITVPARLLADFVSNLPSGNIELAVDGTSLSVIEENYSSTIHGMASGDFPAIPDVKTDQFIDVDSGKLKEAIAQVSGAASSDETRPVLTGVVVKVTDDKLKLAATDSYRLAEKKISLAKKHEPRSVIVPARSLQELQRLIGNEKTVQVYIEEDQVKFVSGDRELTSRLIEGNYPDYEQLVPSETATSFTVDREELMRITKISSLFARDAAGSVTLATNKTEGKVRLSSVAAQVGDNTSSIDVGDLNNDDQVTFNARYLIDALNALPAAKITFGFSGKLAPCVLRPIQKDMDDLYLIMPLRS